MVINENEIEQSRPLLRMSLTLSHFPTHADEGRGGPKKQTGDPLKRREAYVPFAQASYGFCLTVADVIAMQRHFRKSEFHVHIVVNGNMLIFRIAVCRSLQISRPMLSMGS